MTTDPIYDHESHDSIPEGFDPVARHKEEDGFIARVNTALKKGGSAVAQAAGILKVTSPESAAPRGGLTYEAPASTWSPKTPYDAPPERSTHVGRAPAAAAPQRGPAAGPRSASPRAAGAPGSPPCRPSGRGR